MTDTQPEALRLAAWFDSFFLDTSTQKGAAKELRRLHQENFKLKAALEKLDGTFIDEGTKVAQKPVAWMHTIGHGEPYFRKKPQDKVFHPQPVFTHPQRMPLSEDAIYAIWEAKYSTWIGAEQFATIVRSVEQEHYIGKTE